MRDLFELGSRVRERRRRRRVGEENPPEIDRFVENLFFHMVHPEDNEVEGGRDGRDSGEEGRSGERGERKGGRGGGREGDTLERRAWNRGESGEKKVRDGGKDGKIFGDTFTKDPQNNPHMSSELDDTERFGPGGGRKGDTLERRAWNEGESGKKKVRDGGKDGEIFGDTYTKDPQNNPHMSSELDDTERFGRGGGREGDTLERRAWNEGKSGEEKVRDGGKDGEIFGHTYTKDHQNNPHMSSELDDTERFGRGGGREGDTLERRAWNEGKSGEKKVRDEGKDGEIFGHTYTKDHQNNPHMSSGLDEMIPPNTGFSSPPPYSERMNRTSAFNTPLQTLTNTPSNTPPNKIHPNLQTSRPSSPIKDQFSSTMQSSPTKQALDSAETRPTALKSLAALTALPSTTKTPQTPNTLPYNTYNRPTLNSPTIKRKTTHSTNINTNTYSILPEHTQSPAKTQTKASHIPDPSQHTPNTDEDDPILDQRPNKISPIPNSTQHPSPQKFNQTKISTIPNSTQHPSPQRNQTKISTIPNSTQHPSPQKYNQTKISPIPNSTQHPSPQKYNQTKDSPIPNSTQHPSPQKYNQTKISPIPNSTQHPSPQIKKHNQTTYQTPNKIPIPNSTKQPSPQKYNQTKKSPIPNSTQHPSPQRNQTKISPIPNSTQHPSPQKYNQTKISPIPNSTQHPSPQTNKYLPSLTTPTKAMPLEPLSVNELKKNVKLSGEFGEVGVMKSSVMDPLKPSPHRTPLHDHYNKLNNYMHNTAMSLPGSRKGSTGGDSIFQEVTDILTRTMDQNGRGMTSYDLISRTLHQLARDGNSDLLQQALSRLGEQGRRRINVLDGDKLAPLHYAARYAHAGTVKTLIHAGAHVNIRGQDRLTPLHYAARYRKQLRPSRKLSPLPIITNEEENEKEEEEENEDEEAEENGDEEVEDNEDNIKSEEENNINNLSITSTEKPGFGISSIPETSVIRILVENGAEVNARDIYDQTPLHYAAMRGNDPAARDLLKCPQIMPEARDKQLMTPLFVAATYGYAGICHRLIQAGANLFSKDESEQTALHRAAMEGHLEIVELILTAGNTFGGNATVERLVGERDSEGQTALHLAVNNGHYKVAKRLLGAGADVDAVRDTLATPLHAAAAVGDSDLISLLLENHARLDCVDCNQQTPLHRAADHDQSAAIVTLLAAGAKIEKRDKDSFTPLLVASSAGHAEAVQTLLDNGASVEAVDKDDKTAVFWCAEQGNEEALDVLLKNDICVELVDVSDRYDNSPLHEAARHGYVTILRSLLQAGSQIDNKNEDEETALHIAAEAGQVKVVRELVHRYKYLISDENETSNTPLHLACLEGHTDVVRVLLDAGADVDARNSSLWTPLDCASAKGHVLCVSLLLDYDSPLDPMDKTKTTPLQLAAREGHVAVTKQLLERGASLSSCDTTGRNALELAIAAGKKEVCLAIIQSSEWEIALRNVRMDYRGRRVTPFRMLIKKFPDVAEAVLNRCTSTNGMDNDDERFAVRFKFDLIDDTYVCENSYGSEIDSMLSSSSLESPYDEEGRLLDHAETYTSDTRQMKNNHPLMMMVKYKRLNLLSHPVSISLVKHKWMSFGRYVYYSTLAFYTIFLIFLTGYVLTAQDWNTVKMELNISKTDEISCADAEKELDIAGNVFILAGKWVILIMAVINILREIFQFYQARLNYLGLENLMEWCCYITAVLLVWDFDDCYIRQDWQWQVGAGSIFLAWMNLLLFIRKLPFLGIYVVMFTDIFATFLRFFTVFFLFIIAFALSFYTVLKNQDPFNTPSKSLLKTTVMMIGEIEFDNIFSTDDPSLLPYPEITYMLFVAFLILMTILIMNLLVGLAVDDIKAVQDQAILKRLAMQTQLVLDVEGLIPEALRRVHMVSQREVHPNARHTLFSKLFGDFQIIKGFDFVNDVSDMDDTIMEYLKEHRMNEQELMRRDLTQLVARVENLQSQNQRLHALLVALNNVASRGDDSRERLEVDLAKYVW